jgi:hypothetical protein
MGLAIAAARIEIKRLGQSMKEQPVAWEEIVPSPSSLCAALPTHLTTASTPVVSASRCLSPVMLGFLRAVVDAAALEI